MVATPVKIGPFAGGLNTYSGPTSIGDNEAVELVNFDIDLDGSLSSRTPITMKDSISGAEPSPDNNNGEIKLLGWFVPADGTRYLICTIMGAAEETWARNEETGNWTLISGNIKVEAFVQYQNKAYLIAAPDSANNGGYWTVAGGFTAVAAIPRGTSCCIYKERLFIAGSTVSPNRVFFSNAANFETWNTSVNFFDVRSGDGQELVTVFTFQDTVMCFKRHSTYVFSYDSSPSRGTVRLVSGSVGVSNKYCVQEHEGTLYIHYEREIYQVANWNFVQVNLKVPFEYITVTDPLIFAPNYPTLSILANRLVVRHYDAIYVFNLRVGAWSQWKLGSVVANPTNNETKKPHFNYFIPVPIKSAGEAERYYAGCRNGESLTDGYGIYEWRPQVAGGRVEYGMPFKLVTKTYDLNVPYSFKRLFWWGVDIMSRSLVNYKMSPVSYVRIITHQELSAYTHTQLSAGTHARLLDSSIDVTDSSISEDTINSRMFVKLVKSSRFRQIFFTVEGLLNGDPNDSPLRIYSLVGFIDNKQISPNKLN